MFKLYFFNKCITKIQSLNRNNKILIPARHVKYFVSIIFISYS